jgi:hypothetical protein
MGFGHLRASCATAAPCSLVSLFADDQEPAAAATVRPVDAIAPKAEAVVAPKAQQPPKAQPVDSLFKVGTEPQSSLNQCVHSLVPAADRVQVSSTVNAEHSGQYAVLCRLWRATTPMGCSARPAGT